METIQARGLKAGISLKPSHLGLKLDRGFCLANIRRLEGLAEQHHIFIRIDMKDASLCQETLDLFILVHDQFPHVGLVIQTYLRRSLDDINLLIDRWPNIRLCKGAYY